MRRMPRSARRPSRWRRSGASRILFLTIQDRLRGRRRSPPDAGRGPGQGRRRHCGVAATVNGRERPASGKPWRVEVNKGPFMFPHLVTATLVPLLAPAIRGVADRAGRSRPRRSTRPTPFDRGYLQHIASSRAPVFGRRTNTPMPDLDWPRSSRTPDAAKVYAAMILQRLR